MGVVVDDDSAFEPHFEHMLLASVAAFLVIAIQNSPHLSKLDEGGSSAQHTRISDGAQWMTESKIVSYAPITNTP